MRPVRLVLAALIAALALAPAASAGPTARRVVLAVHGGTGSDLVTTKTEAGYRRALTRALRAGAGRLRAGGSSVDAVQAAVEVLEDDPRFNAGRGAVFNTDGHIELDAAIMDGRDRDAGAVAGIRNTKNPIAAARAVKDRSPHVLLGGEGADRFARQVDLPYVTQDYFWTAASWRELRAEKRSAARAADALQRHGTVGAVARDAAGHLAAATSTGGLTNKLVGRIGDSPLVGAGTYADDRSVAVSATGAGEAFIRANAAADISYLMRYRGWGVGRAARLVVLKDVPSLDGDGGVIALDRRGRLATPHSSTGLIDAYLTAGGRIVIRFEGR